MSFELNLVMLFFSIQEILNYPSEMRMDISVILRIILRIMNMPRILQVEKLMRLHGQLQAVVTRLHNGNLQIIDGLKRCYSHSWVSRRLALIGKLGEVFIFINRRRDKTKLLHR